MAHAGGELGPVDLDLLALAPAIALLAAREVGANTLFGDLEPGRYALDDGREAAAMGLTGGEPTQLRHREALRSVSSAASTAACASGSISASTSGSSDSPGAASMVVQEARMSAS